MTKRQKKLTEDDRKIWHKVTKTVTPYGKMTALDEDDLLDIHHIDEKERKPFLKKPVLRSVAESYQPPISKPKVASKGVKQQSLNPIERPVHRKISKGRVSIDARIDLHGMTQQSAHWALYNFLDDAYQQGLRHVLVITGKGNSSGGQGVLKRAVPDWFTKSDFKMFVSGFRNAAQHHGGGGALYVRLRKKTEKIR